MNINKYKKQGIVTACMLALTSLSGMALAQSATSASPDTKAAASKPGSKREAAAIKHVNDSVAVVRKMEADPGMNKLLQTAKGVFIVPTYGRAALGVGGSGGAGVLLVKGADGAWSDPAFYNIGGISLGAQVGVETGPVAMVLNNEKAVNQFMQKNNFTLSANAGLTVVDWNKTAQGTVGTGDVVAWAGTKGLFANVAAIGVNDIRFNQSMVTDYYHQTVSASDIAGGKVKNPQSDALKQALAASGSGPTSGSSGSGGGGATGSNK